MAVELRAPYKLLRSNASLNPWDSRGRDYLSSHRWQGQDIPGDIMGP